MSTSRFPASVLSRPTSNRPLARSTSRHSIAPVAEALPPPRSRVAIVSRGARLYRGRARDDAAETATRSQLADEQVSLRIGLHWGSTVYIGRLLTTGRTEVTALGDEVNEAARIEACATEGRTLASKQLIERLDPNDAEGGSTPSTCNTCRSESWPTPPRKRDETRPQSPSRSCDRRNAIASTTQRRAGYGLSIVSVIGVPPRRSPVLRRGASEPRLGRCCEPCSCGSRLFRVRSDHGMGSPVSGSPNCGSNGWRSERHRVVSGGVMSWTR
ncbi:MAG: adenylate/guanylate cyclase domain-containing protein [Solirubrobacteraceae bacterium]